MKVADYVIIGSGSSGSALTYRLAQNSDDRIIVLEFGGSDFGPFINMPAALSYPMNMKRYDWGYFTEPEPHLDGRQIAAPRGKVIGGSSSINGMVYVRGHARDFDNWAQLGASGWSYRDVVPYFQRMENWHDCGSGGDPEIRGNDGPLHVTRGERKNPLIEAFELAGVQAGYHTTDDYNGFKQEGFGPMEQTIWKGKRWSAASAYLKPALQKSNVEMIRCLARRIIFEGRKAVGVEVEIGKRIEEIRASKEIIVSASAFNSPKLLMLSGIGPAEELAELGIEVLVDRPGVGSNLMDHPEVYIQQACKQDVSLFKYWNWPAKLMAGVQWTLFRTGVGTSNHFESCAFIRSSPGVEYPDIQIHFLPIAIRYDGQAVSEGHGYQMHIGPMRCFSRGKVSLRDSNPNTPPRIQFNYLAEQKDISDFRKCVSVAREIFAQPAFDPYRGKEIQPGENVMADDEIDQFVREHLESAYHPSGTCRMGSANDKLAVVDPQCK
ncbi:MAG: choline dehydrogenase, partial [Rhodobacteraceae bacterium]|nr:choline dehydrogenase [Paracoccaceae bacterium]